MQGGVQVAGMGADRSRKDQRDLKRERRLGFNADLFAPTGLTDTGLEPLLEDARVRAAFAVYDAKARRAKSAYVVLGSTALVAAVVGIIFEAFILTAHAVALHLSSRQEILAHAATPVAAVLVLIVRIGRFRSTWCENVFLRERLRQWHLQRLLHGETVNVVAGRSDDDIRALLDHQFESMNSLAGDPSGALAQFLHETHPGPWLEPSLQVDNVTHERALRLYGDVRVERQLQYVSEKLVGGRRRLPSLEERDRWLESAAMSTLALAIVAAGVSFALTIIGSSIEARSWTAFSALAGAVLSAGARAYRAALTVVEERETYAAYADRCASIARGWAGANGGERIRLARELEEAAAIELQRFLRPKSRSSFLF